MVIEFSNVNAFSTHLTHKLYMVHIRTSVRTTKYQLSEAGILTNLDVIFISLAIMFKTITLQGLASATYTQCLCVATEVSRFPLSRDFNQGGYHWELSIFVSLPRL